MWTKDIIEKFKKEWNLEVNDDTLFFYDREGIVPITKTDNGYRNYTEKDYVKLSKALILTKDFGVPLEEVKKMLNSNDTILKATFLKRRTKLLRILKETL